MESEPNPETTKQRNLRYSIGQYELILNVMDLHPEWREAYEDRLSELKLQYQETKGGVMETEPKIEIKEMPTQEVLEGFLRGMMSNHVTVRFNYEEGVFVENP